MRRYATLALMMVLTVSMLSINILEKGKGEVTNTFYDDRTMTGMTGKVIDFPYDEGTDSSLYFRVGRNVPISEAWMNISTYDPELGTVTHEPFVDVGLDKRLEWMYEGTGYGDFGEQRYFSDDLTRRSFTFTNPSSNSDGKIMIPRGADVISAGMDVRGRFRVQSISNYQIEKDPATISLNGYSVKEGDIDGDGFVDAVISDVRNSRIIWLENPDGNTSASWPLHQVYSGSYASNCYSVDVGDIDGDGDLDIAATAYSGYSVSWFRNDNKGATWVRCTFYTSFYYAGRVRIADMDRDNNPDIVVCSYYYYYYYYNYPFIYLFKAPSDPMYNGSTTHTGSSLAWKYYSIASVPSNFYYEYTYNGFDVGDVNGDDYPDVVVSVTPNYYWYGATQLSRYINPKTLSTSTWSSQTIDSSHNGVRSMVIKDLTGDGNADIIAGAYSGSTITLYENSNTNPGSSWTKRSLISFTNPTFLLTKDFNGDNKTDLMVGGGSGIYEFAIMIQGSTYTSWTKATVTTSLIDPLAFACLDADKDGDTDFMVSGATGSQLVLAVTLSKTPPLFSITWLADGGVKDVRDIDFTDLDGDGDQDMVLCAYGTGWIGWWENDGTPMDSPGKLYRIGALGNAIKVMFADIDGDDDKDVVGMSSSRILYWWENPGNPKGSWPGRQIANNIDTPYGLYAGDFTGDGKADVATSSNVGYSNCYVRLYKCPTNPKTASNWQYNNVATSLSYLKNIWADDMNLDGDLDILVAYGSYGSGVAAYLHNPLGSKDPMSGPWSSVSIDSGLYYPEDIKSIDITDDGAPDVVVTGAYYYSQTYWFQSPEQDQVSGWVKRSLDSSSYSWNLEVGDIGGDGYADILFNQGSYSYPSTLIWYEEPVDYSSSWTKTTLGTHSGTWGLGIVDLDGDEVEEMLSTSKSVDEVRAWKINAAFPSDVGLDVGNDETSNDWFNTGMLKGKKPVDIKSALQEVMDGEPSSVSIGSDRWGTQMVTVPLQLSTGTSGRVQMENIRIVYDATVTLKQDGSGNPLSKVLDRLIPDTVQEGEEYIRIYVLVGSESPGALMVDSLYVEYNAIPKQVKNLPQISVNEESVTVLPFKLDEYFKDDYTPSKDLDYSITLSGPSAGKIAAEVVDNQLVIDTTITVDFFSRANEPYDIYGMFHVKDRGGPNNVPSRTYKTKEFPIIVRNVNDIPRNTGETLQTLYAYEGMETTVVDLDDHDLFKDVDGDPIQYYLEPRFGPNYNETANMQVNWVKATNEIVVGLSETSDWTGVVEVRMYAYDLTLVPGVNNKIDMLIEVLNINDPVIWMEPMPIVEAYEDTLDQRAIELTQFAMDHDTDRDDLVIDIVSQSNLSFYMVGLEYLETGLVYLSLEPRIDNWNGWINVVLSASDGEFTDETTVWIHILPVNDHPIIIINEPLEDARIGESEFSIVGEASDIEGIEWIEIFFDGSWHRPKGTYSWGYTLKTPVYSTLTEDVPLQVRAFDGEEYTYAYVNVTIMPYIPPSEMDYDKDGHQNNVDKFPYDPTEWKDSDRDGIGDNSDEFPNSPEWASDFDKDGKADEADTHPFDPERWNDKNDDGRDDNLPPPRKTSSSDADTTDRTIPFILYLLAIIALLITVISALMFITKYRASKDPRKMAKFYLKQQRWRERKHNILEKLPLASLVREPYKKNAAQTVTASAYPGGFKAAAGPLRSPMAPPHPSRPSLPPVAQYDMRNK